MAPLFWVGANGILTTVGRYIMVRPISSEGWSGPGFCRFPGLGSLKRNDCQASHDLPPLVYYRFFHSHLKHLADRSDGLVRLIVSLWWHKN